MIPLVGGPHSKQGKRPAVRWRPYTRRLPSADELRAWFGERGFPAYGIVCGSVSRLVVLDLDDPALAERFAVAFPALLDTLVVRSGVRGTPHIYWTVDFSVPSRSFPGGDLRGEGGYVVGSGSVIAGGTWQVLTNRPVRAVSSRELGQVLDFLNPPAPPRREVHVQKQPGDYAALYRFYVERLGGRNNALFAATCAMRDAGYAESETVAALAQVHGVQPPLSGGRQESLSRRLAEAHRTIASAFSRPARARQIYPAVSESVSRYPNRVREALLQRPDGAAIARTIEAAHLRGVAPNAIVTEPLLCHLLKGLVSRETIRKALVARYPDGQPIFYPPDHPPAQAGIPIGISGQKTAVLSGGQKQTTARLFILPDAQTLCRRLNVSASGSDPVTLDDVRSSRNYRQALHRALLKRRPGVYSQALLASRVGLTPRSIRRYHAGMHVRAQPTYRETPVLWSTLDQLPRAEEVDRFGIPAGGQFLLDDSGKRWPLKREIAAYLLSRGRQVSHMRQGPNHYACGDQQFSSSALSTQHSVLSPQHLASPQHSPAPQECPDFAQEGGFTLQGVQTRPSTPKHASRRKFRQPLPDRAAERAAGQLHDAIADLSLPNARRLVDTYSPEAAAAALRKFRWLDQHGKVTQPAGLMVTLTRVSWRARQRNTSLDIAAPKFAAEPRRRSRSDGYVHPTSDPLWKSVIYRDWRGEFFGLDDPLLEPTLEEIAF